MKYALNLAADGRILSVTFPQYADEHAQYMSHLPEGNVADYRLVDGGYVYDPLPIPQEGPSQMDRLEAQLVYTAMMTDTLLEG